MFINYINLVKKQISSIYSRLSVYWTEHAVMAWLTEKGPIPRELEN